MGVSTNTTTALAWFVEEVRKFIGGETMPTQIIGVLVITVMSIFGKLLEDCHKFGVGCHPTERSDTNIKAYYECFNIHLSLSLGILGLVWAATANSSKLIFLFIIILGGITSKGVLSMHTPDRLTLSDKDALWGLYIPNACGIAAIIFALLVM